MGTVNIRCGFTKPKHMVERLVLVLYCLARFANDGNKNQARDYRAHPFRESPTMIVLPWPCSAEGGLRKSSATTGSTWPSHQLDIMNATPRISRGSAKGR